MARSVIVAARVKAAHNLPQADAFSESDPYVRLVWGEQAVKSFVTNDDPNPRWDALSMGLNGLLDPEGAEGSIRIEIWDWDRMTPDDLLGHVEIPLRDVVDAGGRLEGRFPLELGTGMSARKEGLPSVDAVIAVQRGFESLHARFDGDADPRRRVLYRWLPRDVGPYGIEIGCELSNHRVTLVRQELDEEDHPVLAGPELEALDQRVHVGSSTITGQQHLLHSLLHPLVDGALERLHLRRFRVQSLGTFNVLEIIEQLAGQAPREFTYEAVVRETQRVDGVVTEPERRRVFIPFYMTADRETASMLCLGFIQVGKLKRLSRTLLNFEFYGPSAERETFVLLDDEGQRLPQEIISQPFERHGYTFGTRITLREVDIAQLPLARITIERRGLRKPKDHDLSELLSS